MVLKCRTRLQATGADGSKRVRDWETPRPGLKPCKSLIRTRCHLKSEEKQCMQPSLAVLKVLTWDLVLHGEAFASTKGFWRSRIQSAQAMHQHSHPFFTARGHVSPPLRAVESIRVSDDKSLGGNVRKWGFLQMKVFLAHSLFTADGRSGGRNPAEEDLSAMSKKTHQCLVRERCATVITTRWKEERKPV